MSRRNPATASEGFHLPSLFSYVVDHDLGFAPNPSSGFCTLVHCKFGGIGGKRNIVEMAEEGDWVLGSGGTSKLSAGTGKIIYLMRVDKKLDIKAFLADPRFQGRSDCFEQGNKFALVSSTFYYFGKNAIPLVELPKSVAPPTLLKKGIGYRRDLSLAGIEALTNWFANHYQPGTHGDPCGSSDEPISPPVRLVSGSKSSLGPQVANHATCSPRSISRHKL